MAQASVAARVVSRTLLDRLSGPEAVTAGAGLRPVSRVPGCSAMSCATTVPMLKRVSRSVNQRSHQRSG